MIVNGEGNLMNVNNIDVTGQSFEEDCRISLLRDLTKDQFSYEMHPAVLRG